MGRSRLKWAISPRVRSGDTAAGTQTARSWPPRPRLPVGRDGAGLAAEIAAMLGPDGAEPHVYVVEPTGSFEDNPNVTDKKFPGNPTRSYRTRAPLVVVEEVTDWTRLTPEANHGGVDSPHSATSTPRSSTRPRRRSCAARNVMGPFLFAVSSSAKRAAASRSHPPL